MVNDDFLYPQSFKSPTLEVAGIVVERRRENPSIFFVGKKVSIPSFAGKTISLIII